MNSENTPETTVTETATSAEPHMPCAKSPSFQASMKVRGLNVVGSEKPVTRSVFLWNARNTIEISGYSAVGREREQHDVGREAVEAGRDHAPALEKRPITRATSAMIAVRVVAIAAAMPTWWISNASWNISHDGTSVSPPGPPLVVL